MQSRDEGSESLYRWVVKYESPSYVNVIKPGQYGGKGVKADSMSDHSVWMMKHAGN